MYDTRPPFLYVTGHPILHVTGQPMGTKLFYCSIKGLLSCAALYPAKDLIAAIARQRVKYLKLILPTSAQNIRHIVAKVMVKKISLKFHYMPDSPLPLSVNKYRLCTGVA